MAPAHLNDNIDQLVGGVPEVDDSRARHRPCDVEHERHFDVLRFDRHLRTRHDGDGVDPQHAHEAGRERAPRDHGDCSVHIVGNDLQRLECHIHQAFGEIGLEVHADVVIAGRAGIDPAAGERGGVHRAPKPGLRQVAAGPVDREADRCEQRDDRQPDDRHDRAALIPGPGL